MSLITRTLCALVGGLRKMWHSDQRVSETWLRQQEQHQGTRGVDSVVVQWPIDKRRNESGLWNRYRLRKRA